jgi:hypothetical protein
MTAGVLITSTGCATTASAPLTEGGRATLIGTIASVDTKPWTYDGNAVVQLDTATHGRVSVQLPARWNLCKAPAVAVDTLVVGRRARASGTANSEGALVVCSSAEDRLVAID